ncbi:HAD hydrolase family protein [Psychrobacter sp. M13]|uniref:HAD hydrolase family protein n=1 Tax=Psychrobacter sp. M13 TaxID=3067275 RepID=UPI00273BEE9F|nr:HAD hydrolase family protein [Psychrobacter sp. M13]WLP95646.1 HAD hydrolase family protein [Psychrobacter sp. M13]
MKRLIFDIDDTLCNTQNSDYTNAKPILAMVEKLREYHSQGFTIVLNTSRNMRTYSSNIGEINKNTLPIIIDWLARHDIPYDEIYVGKPWCGFEGFYIDDKAIRPKEFLDLSYEDICKLLGMSP